MTHVAAFAPRVLLHPDHSVMQFLISSLLDPTLSSSASSVIFNLSRSFDNDDLFDDLERGQEWQMETLVALIECLDAPRTQDQGMNVHTDIQFKNSCQVSIFCFDFLLQPFKSSHQHSNLPKSSKSVPRHPCWQK